MRYLIVTDDGEVERDGDGSIVFHTGLKEARAALRELNYERFNGLVITGDKVTWNQPWRLCELREIPGEEEES